LCGIVGAEPTGFALLYQRLRRPAAAEVLADGGSDNAQPIQACGCTMPCSERSTVSAR